MSRQRNPINTLWLTCCFLILGGLLSTSLHANYGRRTWTDKNGEFQVEADLLDINEETIYLRRKDNRKYVTVPIKVLSAEDVKYLDELRQRIDQSEGLVAKAVEALNNNFFTAVEPLLKKASILDPGAIEAQFSLGLLAIGVHRDPDLAADRFKECVTRWRPLAGRLTPVEKANYVAALNNLALAHVRNRNVRLAVIQWKQAIQMQDATPEEIVQNIGILGHMVMTQVTKAGPADVFVTHEVHREVMALQAKVRLGPNTRPFNPAIAWLYMTYVKNVVNEDEVPGDDGENDIARIEGDKVKERPKNARKVASGSGLVVGDGFILTNRHVALADNRNTPYDYIEVFTGPGYNKPIQARVIAFDRENDLALLHAEEIKGPAFPIYSGMAPLLTSVVTLGFPGGDQFGLGLTMSAGTINRLPVLGNSITHSLWHDAIINGGSSGGPLVAQNGIVVGVNWATFNPGQDLADKVLSAQNYNLAIPSRRVASFLKPLVPDLDLVDNLRESPTSIDKLRDSTIYIETYSTSVIARLPQRDGDNPDGEAKTYNAFEDRACMGCNGTQILNCPNRNCITGKVHIKVYRTTTRYVPGFGNVVFGGYLPEKITCEVCKGRSKIACPFSKYGIDNRFAR
jgi:S1-C subfamily serine protease